MSRTKRELLRERRRKQRLKERLLVVGSVTILALLIVGALILAIHNSGGGSVSEKITPAPPHDYQAYAKGYSLGDPNAPVKIDVWEDFQCVACKRYTLFIEPQVIQTYVISGKVFYTFHHYPFLDDSPAHALKESDQASQAAACAEEQDRFWEYHALLFANSLEYQGVFTSQRLEAFAEHIGLDMEQFKACYAEKRHVAQIQSDIQLGQQWGVSGTPSVFVNKVIITPGYIPSFEDIAQAVETALTGK